MTMPTYVVCKECGARWTNESAVSPRACMGVDCDAGWLDICEFRDKRDADTFAASLEVKA